MHGKNDSDYSQRYQHIRIEPVHYCMREYELAEKRKHKSFFDRNADPKDAPRERLLLLMGTVRARPGLAVLVQSLRLPYMTRESCKAELARTVAVLPNLRYVDLPEGFYSDDPSSTALKQELQAACPEIRRMKYNSGSENSFVALSRRGLWQNLLVLEICGLNLDTQDLLYGLGSLTAIHDLKLVDLPWLDDSVFLSTFNSASAFPPIARLTLLNTPHVHSDGLGAYLSLPQNREVLTHLSLSCTGVLPQQLHSILSRAQYLASLTIIETVEKPFPLHPPTPPLASTSLTHLHYEITSTSSSPRSPRHAVQPVTNSYYTYLISSLLSRPPTLPLLTDLYVRDSNFPESLLFASTPPPRPFANGPPMASSFGLFQPLSIFTKGAHELEWNFTSLLPTPGLSSRRESDLAARPVSLMGAESLSNSWVAGGRKSVVISNGLGNFLAVPTDDTVRPTSRGSIPDTSHGKKERKDLWR